jgi:hypothetical protein
MLTAILMPQPLKATPQPQGAVYCCDVVKKLARNMIINYYKNSLTELNK